MSAGTARGTGRGKGCTPPGPLRTVIGSQCAGGFGMSAAQLSSLVFDQGRVLTYLTIAREFEVPVDVAKRCVAAAAS